MKKSKKQSNTRIVNILLAVVTFICITMTTGYSVYESRLTIDNSQITVRADKEVRITSLQTHTLSSNASVSYTEYNVDELYTDVSLPNESSSIEYKITVKNYGNVEIGISNISLNEEYKDILMVESIQIGDKIRDINNTCEEDINGCKLTIEGEFYITLKYQEGKYNSNNTNFNNIILKIEFNEAFDVHFENFTNFNPTMKELVALKDHDYKIVIENLSANEEFIITMNEQNIYDYNYSNNILTIPNITGPIVIRKEIKTGTYYNISYENITNTNYPTSIKEGQSLTITFSEPAPSNVYVNHSDNYTYENGILIVNNIMSDITIVVLDEIDLPLISTDNKTATVTVNNITAEAPVQVSDLLNMAFDGQNVNTKIINQIDVILTYTSGNGSAQSINCYLKIGENEPLSQLVQFNKGQTTATTVTASFTGLTLGQYENFAVSTSINNISHGKVTIEKMEIIAHYEDVQ